MQYGKKDIRAVHLESVEVYRVDKEQPIYIDMVSLSSGEPSSDTQGMWVSKLSLVLMLNLVKR